MLTQKEKNPKQSTASFVELSWTNMDTEVQVTPMFFRVEANQDRSFSRREHDFPRDATCPGPLVVASSTVVFLGVQSLDYPCQSHLSSHPKSCLGLGITRREIKDED